MTPAQGKGRAGDVSKPVRIVISIFGFWMALAVSVSDTTGLLAIAAKAMLAFIVARHAWFAWGPQSARRPIDAAIREGAQ